MSYPPVKITFLGTGTIRCVPMIGCDCEVCTSPNPQDNRLRSSIMVETPNTTIIVDSGPDFRYQMLRLGVKKVDAIIFTHPHKDHIAGLDDVRAFNYLTRKPMDVYCNYLTEEALRRDFYYAFSDTRYPGVPEINLNTITEQPFTINDLLIEPVMVWHLKMPVMGFRFGPFTYITDANFIEENEKQKIRGSKAMVLNALRKEKHISHFNLEEAVQLVQELEVPEAYFTHISHQLGLHEEVSKELPQGIHLAHDGLVLNY